MLHLDRSSATSAETTDQPAVLSATIRPLRVLTWNIRWGGDGRIARITSTLAEHGAEVLVLTEQKSGATGSAVEAALRQQGWKYQACSGPIERQLGVLIASKLPFTRVEPLVAAGLAPWHMLQVEVADLTILGVYLPWNDDKIPYWEAIVRFAANRKNSPTLLIGDFNTGAALIDGSGIPMRQAHYMTQLFELGFVDPWRRDNPQLQDWTWIGREGIGKRLDHALLSPGAAPERTRAIHDHTPRDAGLSDHSILKVELA